MKNTITIALSGTLTEFGYFTGNIDTLELSERLSQDYQGLASDESLDQVIGWPITDALNAGLDVNITFTNSEEDAAKAKDTIENWDEDAEEEEEEE